MKYLTVMTRIDKGRLLLWCVLLVSAAIPALVSGQININSPYTRFGPGTTVENGLDPRTTAMGGLHYGLRKNDLINSANPASYTAFDSVSFIFDAGIFGLVTNLKTDQLKDNGSYISISHLLFGFPVTKWWRTSFGVLPFSYVGYDIYHTEKFEESMNIVYKYNGSGGFNQLYWGSGFLITKNLSVGFNIKYMFGNIGRLTGVGFPDSLEMMNTTIKTNIRPSDIYGEVGFQYKVNLPKENYMVVGGAFSPQAKINSKATYIASTYFGLITDQQLYYDTIAFIPNEKGTWTLPTKIGVGVTAGKQGNWLAGADFVWQNWENYEYYGQSDSLLNSWNISVGGEYIPDPRSTNYLNRVMYRMGFHYGNTPIYLKGQHIEEVGITFGLGLPIKKSRSTVNLSASFGRKGTTEDGLIQENIFRFTLGVNVFENWFIKSKYF